jgi:hypothetical protein
MNAYTVTLAATPTRIVPTAAQVAADPIGKTTVGSGDQPKNFHIKNTSGANIFVGGSNVTASSASGFQLAANESIEVYLVSDSLWGIGAGGETVNVLVTN